MFGKGTLKTSIWSVNFKRLGVWPPRRPNTNAGTSGSGLVEYGQVLLHIAKAVQHDSLSGGTAPSGAGGAPVAGAFLRSFSAFFFFFSSSRCRFSY